MIKILKSIIAFSIIILISNTLKAQFKIDAHLRNRAEFCDGYKKLAAEDSKPVIYNTQRTRFTLSYETKNLKLKFTPQDVRIWGDEKTISFSGNNGDDASIDFYEAYAEIKLNHFSWLSVGRQELVFDNQSLFSNANWNHNGNSSDALIYKLDTAGWNLQVVGSWNTLTSANNLYSTTKYKSLNIFWLNRKFNDNLNASIIHTASGVTETDTTENIKFRQTTGFYVGYKKDNITASADAYYQYGKSQKDLPVSAIMFDVEFAYKIKFFTPSIGLSYLSGNSKAGTDLTTDNLFDPLYRSRHGYFGGMDYFTKFSSETKQGGLDNTFIDLDFKLSNTLSIKNTFHYFLLAQTNANTPTEKFLGYENDLVCKYKFNDWGVFEAGYLFYIPSESLKTIQAVPNEKFSQFAYLQLTLTPNLFKQK